MKGTKVPKRYYSHADYAYPISKDDVYDRTLYNNMFGTGTSISETENR